MDPTAQREDIDKFIRHIDDILKSCKIDDSKEDLVATLRKIESSSNMMIETRNYLHAKNEDTIKKFETDVERKRKDQKFKEKQVETAAKEADIKYKQREKAEKQK